MIILCPACREPMDWSLDRVGQQPMLYTKCFPCIGSGPWTQEPIEIIRKPVGPKPDHIPQPPD